MAGQCGGTNLDSISISVPVYSTALTVLELAASQSSAYQFQLTYSPSYAGYMVAMLRNVANQNPCRWNLYIMAPGSPMTRTRSAVDNYQVSNNYTIILRYEVEGAMQTVGFSIEYPDAVCSNSTSLGTVDVMVPMGSSALDVMKRAAQSERGRYVFFLSYNGTSSGYIIEELDRNRKSSICSWRAYSVPESGAETELPGSVAEFVVPAGNSRLVLRFREEVLPSTPVPEPITTGGTQVRVQEPT